MFFWFLALSVAGTFLVFRDAAMDYRLVAFGAIVPDLFDGVIFRGVGPLHSVTAAVGLLALAMLVTMQRRVLRRKALALVIGVFAHLVLDGAWSDTNVFWWPFAGRSFDGQLPSFTRVLLVIATQEIVGLAVGVWCYRRFRLANAQRRATFLRTGRVDKRLV